MGKRGCAVAGLIGGGVVAVVVILVLVFRPGMPVVIGHLLFGTVDEPGPRPGFVLPFTCGQEWRLSTYAGHDPDDKKLDMFRVDGQTRGTVVRASADGTVVRLVSPGGVKIDHGGRWYTLQLHMSDISVAAGDQVEQGDPIGQVGSVGTEAAHLHYEQLFDSNGDGYAATEEMRHPVLQGQRYELRPGGDWPVITSSNGCPA